MRKINILYCVIALLFSFLISGCGKKNESSTMNIPSTANTENREISDPLSSDNSDKASQNATDGPKIKFENTSFNFGTVIQGEKLTHTFTFTNSGNSPLIISSASASCGCTTSTPPRAPIRPGENGKIDVTFDSKTKIGDVENKVRVASNSYPGTTVLTIKAHVIKP